MEILRIFRAEVLRPSFLRRHWARRVGDGRGECRIDRFSLQQTFRLVVSPFPAASAPSIACFVATSDNFSHFLPMWRTYSPLSAARAICSYKIICGKSRLAGPLGSLGSLKRARNVLSEVTRPTILPFLSPGKFRATPLAFFTVALDSPPSAAPCQPCPRRTRARYLAWRR